MKEQILLSVPLCELKTLITDAVNDCLSGNNLNRETPKTEIIDRAELCTRLQITPPTAIRWARKGRIPSFNVGNSVRYDYQAVLKALQDKGGRK